MYWGELDEVGMAVAHAVDRLLPSGYRICPPTSQTPNKAPEPTPLLVTDRADARSAPSSGVAHL
jgi:hypothetical protein